MADLPCASLLSIAQRAEQTERALRRAAAASGTQRARRLREVVELNRRVAVAVASRYADQGVALPELELAATQALADAAAAHDPDRGVGFLEEAVPLMRSVVWRHVRDARWATRPVAVGTRSGVTPLDPTGRLGGGVGAGRPPRAGRASPHQQ